MIGNILYPMYKSRVVRKRGVIEGNASCNKIDLRYTSNTYRIQSVRCASVLEEADQFYLFIHCLPTNRTYQIRYRRENLVRRPV